MTGRDEPARAVSFWDAQVRASRSRREPLDGSRRADVCIVGAGFTGLWTAYELVRRAPDLDVVLVEAKTVGFGASGRNGGWVEGMLAGGRARWAKLGGRDGVTRMERAIRETVDEIGRVVAAESIDCGFVKGGTLAFAQTPLEMRRLQAVVADDRLWGVGPEHSRMLDADEARSRVGVDGALAARYSPHCARVQPAALVHGLAAAAERAGVTIYERTPVRRIMPGLACTDRGDVRARFVVRATEAYTASLRGQRRVMLPVASGMIVTERLDARVWDEIGWAGTETVMDGRRRYAYLQRTTDDRIAIGGRGVPYRFASRLDAEHTPPAASSGALRARLVELFPGLADVRVDDAWYGLLGAPRQWAPAVGVDRSSGLAWAGGYVGEGVAAANLAARTLADLLLDRDSELSTLPWVGSLGRRWPPEPLRFAGVRGVNLLMSMADRREHVTGRTSLTGRIGSAISGL